ncbi:alanine racemase [Megalodesulfovibrio gigas]|uniref:Alanine racemase N-terminal domain-containing protein n=1 Tax=Megalodesulfovibrio gigas (strain ATCC 19364 / DSM 1382 / NCIMB 9332 / VKM B-1759) TaxID=1121448 RepID=T2GFH5_MEGG1|nr:alanine racemase [Megalodesulfovibrio gigas]AGW14647.1 hypothetical protein DGI_2921 [Megalodesulfovibrio gigas DSM 1382 = ATCC 19364]
MARIVADLQLLRGNVRALAARCQGLGLRLLPVLKGVDAWLPLAAICHEEGAGPVAVSSVAQAARLAAAGLPRPVMLGLPPLSQVRDVAALCCRSVVSSLEVARALAAQAQALRQSHRVLVMMDLGDGREGCRPDEVPALAHAVRQMAHPWFGLDGVAANFGCLVEAPPSARSMDDLEKVVCEVGRQTGEAGEVSLGGSVLLPWLARHALPACVTELRIGYALLLGHFMGQECGVDGLRRDAFLLAAEVLESGDKRTDTEGLRRRIILDVGVLEVSPSRQTPLEQGMRLVGASSDYLVLDVHECARRFGTGDEVFFRPEYESLARAFHSCSVKKPYNVAPHCADGLHCS